MGNVHRAIFLDRDNTLIHNDGDLGDPDQVRLIRGAAHVIGSLRQLGYHIIVVSNQGGVARGKYTESDVDAVHQKIATLVHETGGSIIDRFYYCPFHPDGTEPEYTQEHPWRKPNPGMLQQAAEDLELDLSECWMIGDQERDVEAGIRAGCTTILISPTRKPSSQAHYQAETLAEAAAYVAQNRNCMREHENDSVRYDRMGADVDDAPSEVDTDVEVVEDSIPDDTELVDEAAVEQFVEVLEEEDVIERRENESDEVLEPGEDETLEDVETQRVSEKGISVEGESETEGLFSVEEVVDEIETGAVEGESTVVELPVTQVSFQESEQSELSEGGSGVASSEHSGIVVSDDVIETPENVVQPSYSRIEFKSPSPTASVSDDETVEDVRGGIEERESEVETSERHSVRVDHRLEQEPRQESESPQDRLLKELISEVRAWRQMRSEFTPGRMFSVIGMLAILVLAAALPIYLEPTTALTWVGILVIAQLTWVGLIVLTMNRS